MLANLYWNPSDDVEWRLRVLAEGRDDGSQRLTSLLQFRPGPFTVASDLAGETSIERYQLSLHGRRDFEWGTLKSITSYQDWELDPSTVDLDFTPDALRADLDDRAGADLWTQELRFESPEGSGPLAWRAGMFASYKDTDGDATRGLSGRPGRRADPITERTVFGIDETTVAGFGRVSYRINERLGLEAGARLEYVKTLAGPQQVDHLRPGTPLDLDTDGVYFSPTGGINYTVADGVNLFAPDRPGDQAAGLHGLQQRSGRSVLSGTSGPGRTRWG